MILGRLDDILLNSSAGQDFVVALHSVLRQPQPSVLI